MSAFLKVEISNNELPDFGNNLISNGTVGHDSVVENGIVQDEWLPLVHTILENGISQVSLAEAGELYVQGIDQIGSSQVGTIKDGTIQKSPTQVSSGQVGIIKERLFQTSPTQVSPTQVSPTQIMFGQISVDQDDPFQVSPYNFIVPGKSAVTEVTLPSSVTLQQFFITNVDKIHTPNFQNTTVSAWTNFLQTLTLLNLKLEVLALLPRQLVKVGVIELSQIRYCPRNLILSRNLMRVLTLKWRSKLAD